MSQKLRRQVYSALEVARLCNVVNQTAINWIKACHLKAFKTPGGQYRVYPEDLESFMRGRKMQIPQELLEAASLKNHGKSILIVDDDKGLNSVLAKYLEKNFEGLEIFQAFDGFEAGARCSQAKPGCVILDLDLPGVDGFSLCERLSKDEYFGKPAIFVITALQDEGLEERALSLGAQKLFKKTISMDAVAERVKAWLES
ncbi:MAG: response regulator [Treponema sp.]|nr:response regulator [Treponema sp.]